MDDSSFPECRFCKKNALRSQHCSSKLSCNTTIEIYNIADSTLRIREKEQLLQYGRVKIILSVFRNSAAWVIFTIPHCISWSLSLTPSGICNVVYYYYHLGINSCSSHIYFTFVVSSMFPTKHWNHYQGLVLIVVWWAFRRAFWSVAFGCNLRVKGQTSIESWHMMLFNSPLQSSRAQNSFLFSLWISFKFLSTYFVTVF